MLTLGFKPYYKWIVLNTQYYFQMQVSLLQYCFKPYYKWIVLNTVVHNGRLKNADLSFKPYYKWIVLNTYLL